MRGSIVLNLLPRLVFPELAISSCIGSIQLRLLLYPSKHFGERSQLSTLLFEHQKVFAHLYYCFCDLAPFTIRSLLIQSDGSTLVVTYSSSYFKETFFIHFLLKNGGTLF